MIKHFYHIYADGEWETPVIDHIKALKQSGLLNELEEFKIGIVGAPTNREAVTEFITNKGIKFEIVGEADTGWEQVTLRPLREDAVDSPPYKVLYAHTKGAANRSPINTYWRIGMTKETVNKWKSCIALLEDHDAVGPHWVRKQRFFAGNFWWANSSFISTLSPPTNHSRWDAEAWLRVSDVPFRIFDICPGAPFVERVPSRTHEVLWDSRIVTFRCDGKVLHYKPRQTYREPLNSIIRPILERGKDLVLLDPLSLDDLDARIKAYQSEGDETNE